MYNHTEQLLRLSALHLNANRAYTQQSDSHKNSAQNVYICTLAAEDSTKHFATVPLDSHPLFLCTATQVRQLESNFDVKLAEGP